MKILVLGLGISGRSVVSLLEKEGHQVLGVDDKQGSPPIAIEEFDLFVPSPGIPRTHPLYLGALKAGLPIKGEVQIALERISTVCIGVTGTNGKTTTVKMIEHCLNRCGKKALAVGNVGLPLSSFVETKEEILVVELSSFQLETLTQKAFSLGFLLNIEEDHLDRYDNFAEYAEAKYQLGNCIKEEGLFYLGPGLEMCHNGIPFDGSSVEAARISARYLGIGEKAFFEALTSFEKPPHRLEFVATVDGISYFNDSKATNVAAVLEALRQMEGKVVLLAGGQDKGLSFAPLLTYKEKLSHVIAFGAARFKIEKAVQNEVEVHLASSLEEAMELAKQKAKKGESILLSPGCASFDAFKNYEERGNRFKVGVTP